MQIDKYSYFDSPFEKQVSHSFFEYRFLMSFRKTLVKRSKVHLTNYLNQKPGDLDSNKLLDHTT